MKSQILVKELRPGHSIFIAGEDLMPYQIIEIQGSIDMSFLDITIETGDVTRLFVDSKVTIVREPLQSGLWD